MENTSSVEVLKRTVKDRKEEEEMEIYWKEEKTSVTCYSMNMMVLTHNHIYISQ